MQKQNDFRGTFTGDDMISCRTLYKANGFRMPHLGDFPLQLEEKPED